MLGHQTICISKRGGGGSHLLEERVCIKRGRGDGIVPWTSGQPVGWSIQMATGSLGVLRQACERRPHLSLVKRGKAGWALVSRRPWLRPSFLN